MMILSYNDEQTHQGTDRLSHGVRSTGQEHVRPKELNMWSRHMTSSQRNGISLAALKNVHDCRAGTDCMCEEGC